MECLGVVTGMYDIRKCDCGKTDEYPKLYRSGAARQRILGGCKLDPIEWIDSYMYAVECGICGAVTYYYENAQDAVEAWNNRELFWT